MALANSTSSVTISMIKKCNEGATSTDVPLSSVAPSSTKPVESKREKTDEKEEYYRKMLQLFLIIVISKFLLSRMDFHMLPKME